MDACLSCFSSKCHNNHSEPLLPKHSAQEAPPDDPLGKLADVLGALSAGKLPSQTQINTLLRQILHSNILQETQNTESRVTPEVLRGKGPLSTKGRKLIQDVTHLVEAALQFGMEKNDDDLLQDLFFQFSQIQLDDSPVTFGESPSAKNFDFDEHAEASQRHVLHKSGLSQDAKTMVKALKTLFTTSLTSSVFRLILTDVISIGRELVAHVASDIGSAASRIHDVATDVQHRATEDNFGRSTEPPKAPGELASTLVREGRAVTSGAVHNVPESIRGKGKEWEEHVVEAEEGVKQEWLTRIREMVVRAQQDPSSRHAISAILQIIRKYAHKFALASQETVENTREEVAGPSSGPGEAQAVGSGTYTQTGLPGPSSYPPQPYSPTLPHTLIPGIEIDSPELQHILQGAKVMLERLAQGHKTDDMLKTLGDIIRHLATEPRNVGKGLEKLAQGKLHHEEDDSSSVGTTKHTEHHGTHQWTDEPASPVEPSGHHGEREHKTEERVNLFFMYFSSVGRYLDRALSKPGWATSKAGKKSLESLYEATQELFRMTGDVVADADKVIRDGVEEFKDLNLIETEFENAEDVGPHNQERLQEDHAPISTQEKNIHRTTNQWVRVIVTFLKQAGDYVDAIQRDRTTMKLVHALEELRKDVGVFLGTGRQEMGKADSQLKFQPQCGARDSGTGKLGLYTQWLGWALPRLLHLLPLGAIPIPRVEVQTENTECAFDAIWIQRLVPNNGRIGGRSEELSSPAADPEASWRGETATLGLSAQRYGEDGIGGKLVPDEVLVRQWTEVKVKFAEGTGAAAIGATDAQQRMGLASQEDRALPGIEATSRMGMHMNGIKACVRGMGYYFKYTGSLFEYEDEGLLSIDLGTATGEGRHSGFGLDIELEMDSGDVEMDLQVANAMADIPIVVIEDVDLDSDSDYLNPDIPPNLDIQEAIYEACHRQQENGSSQREDHDMHPRLTTLTLDRSQPSRLPIDTALTSVVPLFRVLNVRVDLHNVRFKFDKSRHWIFNKLVIEPFAGSFIKRAAKYALEERVRKALEAMSCGMAVIMMEAKKRAANRLVRYLSVCESSDLADEAEYKMGDEEDGEMRLGDVYAALIERGPEIFSYYAGEEYVNERDHTWTKAVRTETRAGLTKRGVVVSRETHTGIRRHQPSASRGMTIPNSESTDDESGVGSSGFLREQECLQEESDYSGDEQDEEITVAVGVGPQLFPGKGGPYDISEHAKKTGKAVLQEVQRGTQKAREEIGKVQEGVGRAKGELQEGYQDVKGKKRRFFDRRKKEKEDATGNWRSSAFDF